MRAKDLSTQMGTAASCKFKKAFALFCSLPSVFVSFSVCACVSRHPEKCIATAASKHKYVISDSAACVIRLWLIVLVSQDHLAPPLQPLTSSELRASVSPFNFSLSLVLCSSTHTQSGYLVDDVNVSGKHFAKHYRHMCEFCKRDGRISKSSKRHAERCMF